MLRDFYPVGLLLVSPLQFVHARVTALHAWPLLPSLTTRAISQFCIVGSNDQSYFRGKGSLSISTQHTYGVLVFVMEDYLQ
jgi:hypothetical protein